MAVPRASMWRTARLIHRLSSVARRRSLQQVERRAYSSGSTHGPTQASSDLPWAIGALVVTVPSLSYILWPKPKDTHEHSHGDHKEHGDSKEHAEDDDGSKHHDEKTQDSDEQDENSEGDENSEAPGAEDVEKAEVKRSHESGDDEAVDESSSDGEQEQNTPASSEDDEPTAVSDADEAIEGQKEAQFKGPAKGGPPSDHRTTSPDPKGLTKKRIESDYGKPQGLVEGKDAVDYDSEHIADKDKAAAAKPAGDSSTMSGKQEGLSNTDTKHSTDLLNDPNKSMKPEGQPETAKLKGTVDPKRGQNY